MAFVGRETELAMLASALQRAADGRPTRVAMTAPAGMGSSRLLAELVRRVSPVPGVTVAHGVAVEPGTGEAFQAPAEALRSSLLGLSDERLDEVVGSAYPDLVVLIPELEQRLGPRVHERSAHLLTAPDQLGRRVVESIIGVLDRLAGDGVLLLVLEDLHWSDPATRRLLRTLVGLSMPLQLCTISTYRPDELHRRHPAHELFEVLGAQCDCDQLRLGPLGHRDLEHMVEGLLGERPSGDLMTAVAAGSQGNPLIASQLVAGVEGLHGIRLSDPFDEIVGARVAALSQGAARLVNLLAAARQPLARNLAIGVLSADRRTLPSALDEAVSSGFVTEQGGSLAISHELYAEAVDRLQLPAERVRLHALLAKALADRPARAAWHLEQASAAGARHAHAMAAQAMERLDPGDTALLHWQRLLELAADQSGPDSQVELGEALEHAADAAATAGSYRRAAALVRRAIDARAAEAGPSRRDDHQRRALGALNEKLGRYLWTGGDLEAGLEAMQHALELMPTSASLPRVAALATLAQHLMVEGRFEDSAAIAAQARAMAIDLGAEAHRELGHVTCTLGVDRAYLGGLDEGLGLLEEAETIARKTGRLDDLIRVAANRTTLLDLDSRRLDALEVVSQGIVDAESGGLAGTYGAFLRGNTADILYQLGRWEESQRECRAAMEWQPAGVAWFSPTLYLGLVLVESRGDEEARLLVGQTMLQLDTVPVGQWTALVQRAAVSQALWQGDARDAIAVASRSWPRVLETGEQGQICLAASTCLEAAAAAAEDARGRHDLSGLAEANELAERVLPEATRAIEAWPVSRTLGARVEAELHLATARAHEARVRGRSSTEAWGRIAAAWSERLVPYPAAKAYWWQALAAIGTGGSRDAAREPLEKAWGIAERLPARPLLRALSDLARRARVRIAQRTAGYETPGLPESPAEPVSIVGRQIGAQIAAGRQRPAPYGLSPRELEVLAAISEGHTDREIGERLFISEKTVHVHVRHVLAKLGVSSRTQAASLALRQRMVTTSGDGVE
jgi:DNA-binding CsgD family transcriptional regulator/tetratricopeptide (TPR) repeat protein